MTAPILAEVVPLQNPGLELNDGVDGEPLSGPSVVGWDGSGGFAGRGRTDYGNGGWRIGMEDGDVVFQMSGHAISAGEAFSLRFDAAPFEGNASQGPMFVSDLSLVGAGLRNGDFNEDAAATDSRTFNDTPHWTNLGTAGQGSQATRTTLPVDGTRNAVMNRNGSRVFAVDTGHTLATNKVFQLTYQWRDASSWTDNANRIRATLFTTSDDTITGTRSNVQEFDSALSTSNNTYELQIDVSDPIPAASAGRRLFLSLGTNVGSGAGGFARIDNVTLDRGMVDEGEAPAPGVVIADLYVDEAGSREVVATRSWSFENEPFGSWKHRQLLVPAGALDAHAGKTLGVQFRGVGSAAERFHAIDNLQLEVFAVGAGDSFSIDWNTTPDQVWPGPGFWGNRLHDWNVVNNRVECILGNRDRRTLHRTGTSVLANGGGFSLGIRTGLRSGAATNGSRSGFLIGAGIALDWRASMLVHDGLGRDFGLFCGITGNGAAVIEDYSTGAVTRLATGTVRAGGLPADTRLQLAAAFDGEEYELTLQAFEAGGATAYSTAVARVSSERVLGSFGLLSHRGGSLATHWYDDFSGSGAALRAEPDRSLGIVWAMHTLSHGSLTMAAQLMPLDRAATPTVFLETFEDGAWGELASAPVDTAEPSAYNAVFRVPDWPVERDVRYRLRVPIGGVDHFHEGTVKREPTDKETLTVASVTCQRIVDGSVQADGFDWSPVRVWHPHAQPIEYIGKHQPDIIAATGDQIYEGQPTPEDSNSDYNRHHDYLYKWYLFALQFRDLARYVPMFCMPDDHDVFQGNLWGEGGVFAPAQNDGGYEEPARWVRMIERTQYSSLPPADPYNPTQPPPRISPSNDGGLEVAFTGISFAGLGIAVIEDRKFKTGRNDPRPEVELELLGERQHAFLEAFAQDWSGDQKVKFVVSQSPLGNIHTHANTGYGYGLNDRDSHGWPPERRKDAWRALRKGFMFQLAGDQHLASVVRHGIEDPRDAGYSFTSPAIANFFPRCFDPDHPMAGRTNVVRDYKGDFFFDGSDGRPASQFPHHLQLVAAANPLEYYNQTSGINPTNLNDRGAGYGLAKINKRTREITFECWPRHADPEQPQTGAQFPDWPVTIRQVDNEGRTPTGFLRTVRSESDDPVVTVFNESGDDLVYSLRIRGRSFKPPVFDNGTTYRVELRERDNTEADQIFVRETAAAPAHNIESFEAEQRQIIEGGTVRLHWQTCASETLTLELGGVDLLPLSNFGSGFIEVSPSADTTYTLRSEDAAGGVLTEDVTVRVFGDREAWRAQHFTPEELANSALEATLWGDDADPDGDGLSNCFEHLLQGDPLAPSPELLPSSNIGTTDDLRFIDHAFSEPIATGEVEVMAEQSGAMQRWRDVPGLEEIGRSLSLAKSTVLRFVSRSPSTEVRRRGSSTG